MRERKHLPNDIPEYSRQHETKKKLFWLQTEILVQRQKFFAWIYDPWSTSSYLLEKRKSASLMRDMVNNIQAEGEGGCTVSTLVNVLSKSALSGYYRPPPLPVVNYRNSTVGFSTALRTCYQRQIPSSSFPPSLCTQPRASVSKRRSLKGHRFPVNESLCNRDLHASWLLSNDFFFYFERRSD